MATGTINATKYLKRQGIESGRDYEALVVENNDPRFLGRIKARIKGIFDGIPDDDLPWCVPRYHHADGASKDAGCFFVPKKNNKVTVSFIDDDPHRPEWRGYVIDDTTVMAEAKINYPDRGVIKFSNGFFIVVDTKTHELFLNNPGDFNVTVLGDMNQTVVGRQTTTTASGKGTIPSYLINANPVMSILKENPTNNIPFSGLGKSSAGSHHYRVEGDYTMEIMGDRKIIVHGNDDVTVKKGRIEKIAQTHRISASRTEVNG